jgi:hypothetical protein
MNVYRSIPTDQPFIAENRIRAILCGRWRQRWKQTVSLMSRLLLQIVTGLLGVATLALGSMQLGLGVDSPIYAAADLPDFPMLDSNLRFFGGMAIGLALALLWILPTIERQTLLFRIAWGCAFLGGIGRLVSVAAVGTPSTLLLVFTWIEIVGAPLLIYWQYRVARSVSVIAEESPGGKPSPDTP